jgi:hypothetical protein
MLTPRKNVDTFVELFPALAHVDLTFTYSPSSQPLCNRFLSRIPGRQLRSLKLSKTLVGTISLLNAVKNATELREFSMVTVGPPAEH